MESYYGVTHPSEPNYAAAAGGDFFGMGNDAFYAVSCRKASHSARHELIGLAETSFIVPQERLDHRRPS